MHHFSLFGTRSGLALRLVWIGLALVALVGMVLGAPLQIDRLGRGVLGIWTETQTEGQLVVSVMPGLSAEQVGLQPGDMILTINNQPAAQTSFAHFANARVVITYREQSGAVRRATLVYTVPTDLPLNLSPRFFPWLSVTLDALFVLAFLTMGTLILWSESRRAAVTASNVPSGSNGAAAAKNGISQRGFAFVVAFFLLSTAIRLPPEISLLLQQSKSTERLALWLGASGYVLFPLVLALFPNGRWQPRWIWIYPLAGLILTLVIGLTTWTPSEGSRTFGTVVEASVVGVGIIAQIYRYRWASTAQERQQTKWALFGFSIAFVLYYLFQLINLFNVSARLFPVMTSHPAAANLYFTYSNQYYLVMLTAPITLAISIMRYRLWEIDLIIRRTLVYSLVTSGLALVYFGTVVLLQFIFRLLTGQSSILAIVLSTLIISVLFAPLRDLARGVIDRRFFRRKYNATKTLDAFSSILRDEVDLDHLTNALVQVVDGTLQPDNVSLWIITQSQTVQK